MMVVITKDFITINKADTIILNVSEFVMILVLTTMMRKAF